MSVGRISLAYRDLSEIPANVMPEIIKSCKILDLSSNHFADLYPLRELVDLEELILDDNKITAHTKFPPLPKLQNLWVNRNQINSLTFFIDKLVASCPDLIMLSMLNNEACPNYFNSGTPTQYQDYRYYVIHRLTKLQILDATPVSAAEREEARKKYGTMASTTEAEAQRRASESALLAKKKAEKERRELEKMDEMVRQRQEEKRNRRKKKPSAAPSVPPAPRLPTPNGTQESRESNRESSDLPDLPDINEDENTSELAKIRVFPPLPPLPSANLTSSTHGDEESTSNALGNSQGGVEWDLPEDDNDDDWSDSE